MGNKTRNTSNLVSDNNIFVDISNDYVGIGSTQPTTKLDVVGTIKATSFSGITTSMISDYGNGLDGGYSNANLDNHINVGTANTGEVLSWNGSDYDWVVGVNTANINAETLNVSGVSTFQGNITLGDNDKINFYTTNTKIYGNSLGLNVTAAGNRDIILKSNDSGGSSGDIILRTVQGGRVDLTGTGGVGIYHTDTAKKFETTTDGFKVVNGTSETAVISGPQNIILDPSPDDVVAIVEGDISAAGVSTITGITTTNIAVGNLIQEVDGVISAGTTVTSVGASQVGISKTSLGSATNQEFTFANQTPTGIVRIKGDLYVDGTRTEINSTTLTIDDLNIVVASGATNALTADTAGLTVDGADAYLKYNYNAGTNETWELNKNVGIGTDNAEAKLDVRGDVLLPNGSATLMFGPDTANWDLMIGHNGQFPNSGYIANVSGDLDYTSQKHIFSDEQEQWKYLELSDTESALYGANTKKLSVSGAGVSITDDLNVTGISTFQDHVVIGAGKSIQIGPTADQLSLEYDANGLGLIRQNAELFLLSPSTQIGNLDGSKISATFLPTGGVNLKYNNNDRLQTTASGINVIGHTELDQLRVSGVSTFADSINVSGFVTATTFSGDGASLINVDATTAYSADLSTLATTADNVSGKITYTEFDQISQVDQPAGTPVTSGTAGYYHDIHAAQSYLSKDGKTLFSSRMNRSTENESNVVTIYERNQSGFNFVGFLTETTYATVGAAQTVTHWGPIVTSSADGSIFAIGSPDGFEDYGATQKYWFLAETGANGNGQNTGSQQSVHIYQRTGSNIESLGIITAGQYGPSSDNGGVLDSGGTDGFGLSMAFSNDGSKLYIAAPEYFRTPPFPHTDSTPEFARGRVYAFDKSGSSYNFVGIITQTRDSTNNDDGNKFGYGLACSADGNKIYIGDPLSGFGTGGNPTFSNTKREGVVYAFDRSGSNFNCVGIISTGLFPVGTSVTVYGSAQFGYDITCSDDGNTIVIGAPRIEKADPDGSVNAGGGIHIVSRSGNSFSASGRHIHTAADGGNLSLGYGTGLYFGRTLASNSDATKILTSKWTNGSSSLSTYGEVWVYSRSGSNLTNVGILTSPRNTSDVTFGAVASVTYGSSLSIDSTGDTIGIGAPGHIVPGETMNDAGAVFLFSGSRETALYGNQITNNIGIGTDNPTSTLDVDGTLNVSGISTLADIVLTGSANSITFDPSTNNNKTFFIRGEGNGNATIENDDEMYVSSTHLYIQKPGGTTTMAEFIEDGAVKLNHNNITKLQTHDYGIDVTGRVETDTLNVSGISTFSGNVNLGDDNKLLLGANDDLEIYHNSNFVGSTKNFIDNGVNVDGLYIRTTFGDIEFKLSNKADNALKLIENGAVELYYDNSKKLETTGYGVTVIGGLNVSGISTFSDDVNIGTGVTIYGNSGIVSATSFVKSGGTSSQFLMADGSVSTGGGGGLSPDLQGNLYAGTGAGASSDNDTYCNIALGYNAGNALNAGDHNVFLGTNAGATSNAFCNVSIGYSAGYQSSSASKNVLIGLNAGKVMDTASQAVVIGQEAGCGACPGGCGSVFIGYRAGTFKGNSSGESEYNVAIGYCAGAIQGSGSDFNVLIGRCAGRNLIGNSTNNILIGQNAGWYTTYSSSNNIAIGQDAAKCGTGCGYNVYIGYNSGKNTCCVQSGQPGARDNTFLGWGTGSGITTARFNTFLGAKSGESTTDGNYNVAIGYGVTLSSPTASNEFKVGIGTEVWLRGDSSFNIYDKDGNQLNGAGGGGGSFSPDAEENLYAGTSAGASSDADTSYNIGIGYSAGYAHNQGDYNVSMGYLAGTNVAGASGNVFIGQCAGKGQSGNSTANVFIGASAGCCINGGGYNVSIGCGAGQCISTGVKNVFLGIGAGRDNSTGVYNVNIGPHAGNSNTSCYNIFLGAYAGDENNTGKHNIAIGCYAARRYGSGSCNIAIGNHAGCCVNGNYNVFLGEYAGHTTTSGSCNVAIGYSVALSSVTDDMQFAVGIGSTVWMRGDSSFNIYDKDGNQLNGSSSGGTTTTGSFTATAGVAYTANTYTSSDFETSEYTLFFEHTSGIQSQKVLVMDDETTAYSQEYAIMSSSDLLVSVGATIKSGNVELWFTPESGVSGIVTYKFTRETIS